MNSIVKLFLFTAPVLFSSFAIPSIARAFDPSCTMVDKAPIVSVLKQIPVNRDAEKQLSDYLEYDGRKKQKCLQIDTSDVPDELFSNAQGVRALAFVASRVYLVNSEAVQRKALPALKSLDPEVRSNAVWIVASGGSFKSQDLANALVETIADYGPSGRIPGGNDSFYDSRSNAAVFFGWDYATGLCPCSTETNIKLAEALLTADERTSHYLVFALVPQKPSDDRILIPMARFISLGYSPFGHHVSAVGGVVSYFIKNPNQSPAVVAEIKKSLNELRSKHICTPDAYGWKPSECKDIEALNRLMASK